MGRALVVIRGDADRRRVAEWAARAYAGTRVEFKASKRTLPQNDRMWAMLTDISMQKEHGGRRYSPEDWKAIFMHALGRELRFVPDLEGSSFIPLGYHSSDLSKQEMSELIELMLAWGTENGVTFHDREGVDVTA